MTYKNAYFRLFVGDIPFFGIDPFSGQFAPPVIKQFTRLGTGTAGAEYRFGNIRGSLKAPADKYPGLVGQHGVGINCFIESVRVELYAKFFR